MICFVLFCLRGINSIGVVLKFEGHEVYLVGGCVRDLILKRIPKDFDIITSAELKEVISHIFTSFFFFFFFFEIFYSLEPV